MFGNHSANKPTQVDLLYDQTAKLWFGHAFCGYQERKAEALEQFNNVREHLVKLGGTDVWDSKPMPNWDRSPFSSDAVPKWRCGVLHPDRLRFQGRMWFSVRDLWECFKCLETQLKESTQEATKLATALAVKLF